jgi:hypothetical protein
MKSDLRQITGNRTLIIAETTLKVKIVNINFGYK